MVQVMLQPRRDHGDDADASTTAASGNGVIDDVVFLHRAVPGTCRHARSTVVSSTLTVPYFLPTRVRCLLT